LFFEKYSFHFRSIDFKYYIKSCICVRFDLLFVLLDKADVENDRKIADHVVRMHR
jgi:DNA replicative helicase MCM subunit Mcm2 (Cdc46/Mcm family)